MTCRIYSVSTVSLTSLEYYSIKQQPCTKTDRSFAHTCVCDRHIHSGMQLDARTLLMPCSAKKSSSKHCSSMASVPASATGEATVIDSNQPAGTEMLGDNVGAPRLYEPELSSASRPHGCHSCI
jgi:hypothetical protein